jgi:hypothetical protein
MRGALVRLIIEGDRRLSLAFYHSGYCPILYKGLKFVNYQIPEKNQKYT